MFKSGYKFSKKITSLLLLVFLGGCMSYVKTYNANGDMLGECTSGGLLFGVIPVWGFGNSCVGSANPSDQMGKNYIQNLSDAKALYTTLYALFQFKPSDAEIYLSKDVSPDMIRSLDLYIGAYKIYQGMNGRSYPDPSLSGNEQAFLDWLVLEHPAFADISGAFKK